MRNNPINRFQKQRRKQVYRSLDATQEDRYNEFMSSKFDDKKIKELLQELTGHIRANDGGRSRMLEEVTSVFQMAARMYCGQLTEEARCVQQQELAFQFGGFAHIPKGTALGPIQPHHLQGARQRLLR